MIHRVTPQSVLKTNHETTALISSPNHRCLLAPSGTDNVSFFLQDEMKSLSIPGPIDSISPTIDCKGETIAFADPISGKLQSWSLSLNEKHEISPLPDHFDCYFDESDRLWTVRAFENRFIVELRRGISDNALVSPAFSDSYYIGGGALIGSGGSRSQVIITTYSGQSEAENYLAELVDDKIKIVPLTAMGGEQFPFAAPHGDEIITLDLEAPQLHRFMRPFDSAERSVTWPYYDENESEDELPGYDCCYLNDVNALVASSEGRLFTLHTRSMEITSEIRVEGFAPDKDWTEGRPFGSALVTFNRLNDQVYFLFGRGGRQRVAIVSIDELLALS